jgi:hypothetical protein
VYGPLQHVANRALHLHISQAQSCKGSGAASHFLDLILDDAHDAAATLTPGGVPTQSGARLAILKSRVSDAPILQRVASGTLRPCILQPLFRRPRRPPRDTTVHAAHLVLHDAREPGGSSPSWGGSRSH